MRKLKYVKLFENFIELQLQPIEEGMNSEEIWGYWGYKSVMQKFSYDNYNNWINDLDDDDDRELIKKRVEKVKNNQMTKERFNELLHRNFDIYEWKKIPEFLKEVSTEEEEEEVSTKKKEVSFVHLIEEKLRPLTKYLYYEHTKESKNKVDEFFVEFLKNLNLPITLEEIKTRVCKTNAAYEFRKDEDKFYKTLYKISQRLAPGISYSLAYFFEEEGIFKNNN